MIQGLIKSSLPLMRPVSNLTYVNQFGLIKISGSFRLTPGLNSLRTVLLKRYPLIIWTFR